MSISACSKYTPVGRVFPEILSAVRRSRAPLDARHERVTISVMNQVEIHHILVDGRPLCQIAETEPWAKFFTCFYQWGPTARQAASKIAAISSNKGRRVEVVKGPCVCGR